MSGPRPRTIAITGATGLVGSALCRHLAAAGYSVRALSRRPIDLSMRDITRVAFELPGRIGAEALAGCDAVVHAAYTTRARSRAEARRVNEDGTHRLLDACRAAGVGRVIFISSMSARPDARSYYGQSKFRLETAIDPARGLVIRPGLVLARHAGLFARMVHTIQAHRFIPLIGRGDQPLQTVHIDDLCIALTAAIERELAGTVTIAEPDPIPLRRLLSLVAGRLHRRVSFVPVPTTLLFTALRAAEMLGIPLAATSDNLLGLVAAQPVDTRPDEHRLGVSIRPAALSLDQLLTTP